MTPDFAETLSALRIEVETLRIQVDALERAKARPERGGPWTARTAMALAAVALLVPIVWLGVVRKLPFALKELRAESVVVRGPTNDGPFVAIAADETIASLAVQGTSQSGASIAAAIHAADCSPSGPPRS